MNNGIKASAKCRPWWYLQTMIYMPPEFIHCPFRILEVERPFIFIQAQYAGKLTETSLKKMVAEELRDEMIFIDADGSSEG